MESVKINKITRKKEKTSDITVRNNHNFFANNHLMHNCFYSGEVHIDVHNVGGKILELKEGQKVAQMVMVPILSCDLTEVSEEMLYDWMKEDQIRGEGGFGSTDLKKENEELRREIRALKETNRTGA